MAQISEAACLLQTGALYTRRLGLKGASDELVFVGIKRGAFSLYFGDAPIYHFDLEGRWQRAFLDGIHYRKGLDNAVVAIDRVREGANLVLKRRALSFAEVSDLDEAIRGVAIDLIERISAGHLDRIAPPEAIRPIDGDDLRALLDQISRWDAPQWFSHREHYLAAYVPLGFLPPDAHQAVVLQATVGDSRRRRFGGGEPAEHATRTPKEFADHVRLVAKLLGRRILQNNGVFLAEGDVLRGPIEGVLADFDAIAEVFPLREASGPVHILARPEDEAFLGGVDLFLDDWGPALPERDGLKALKAKGLRRINLGLESGARELRNLAGSLWNDAAIRAFVAEARAAGVALGVILLVGSGGQEWADRHVDATVNLADSLDLGAGDLVYLIDAAEISAETLGGGRPLSALDTATQTKILRERLLGVRGKGAKVAPYSLEKQWN